jgi:hypothetical protein
MKITIITALLIISNFANNSFAANTDSILINKHKLDTLLTQKKIDSLYYKNEMHKLLAPMEKRFSEFNNKAGIIKGERTKQQIMTTVMKYLKSVRELYNSKLTKNDKLKGNIMVNLKIKSDGKVLSAKTIESTMNDLEFEKELCKNITTWEFDKCKNDTTELNYPFIFSK